MQSDWFDHRKHNQSAPRNPAAKCFMETSRFVSHRTVQCALFGRKSFFPFSVVVLAVAILAGNRLAFADESTPIYTYTVANDNTRESYDEAVAASSIQGIINRQSPTLYLLSKSYARPQYWLDILSKDGRWLAGRGVHSLKNPDALVKLAGDRLKGAVIWDPSVPATINVATTIAGVNDCVVLSPEYAERYLKSWKLPVVKDLRGLFDGKETGSRKNDAYRWAIREYLKKNLCSSHLLCLYEDACLTRDPGNIGYAVTRDWAVKNRAFVFDLSPWGDELPTDDPQQKLGADLETYRAILAETLRCSAGKQMTELAGFFVFLKYSNMKGHKSKHHPVATEWETVRLISPYNCYQNTVAHACYNQSFHSQAPRKPLKQRRPAKTPSLANKTYLCFLMADYDSATPLYDFLPNHWNDPYRGKAPLAWGINPNLMETYPDIITYFYETATRSDTFTSDASAAGYMNPNRILPEYLPLFIEHNRRFFRETDMRIAPMVLDQAIPSPAVKDAFAQFAPNGMAAIISPDGFGGRHALTPVEPHVWKGMPVTELLNNIGSRTQASVVADLMSKMITARGNKQPDFHLFRIVWVGPKSVADAVSLLRRNRPELNIELLGPNEFFSLFKEHYSKP
jgi:hypothetical protein